MNALTFFEEIVIPFLCLIALGITIYNAVRIRHLETRISNVEANFSFIKDMLVEIDSKLIKLDIENHIREKLAAVSSPEDIDEREITEYVKNLIDKHKKITH